MAQNNKRIRTRIISVFVSVCLIGAFVPMQAWAETADTAETAYALGATGAASAAPAYGAYVIHNGAITYYDNLSTAWRKTASGDTVGLLKDYDTTGALNNEGMDLKLELNGHRMGRAKGAGEESGSLLVLKGGSVTVYGGRQNWTMGPDGTITMPESADDRIDGLHFGSDGFAATSGTESKNLVQNLYYLSKRDVLTAKEDSRYPVYGGLMCGGWKSTSGGAIQMNGADAVVSVYDTTIAGNRGEENGGAIAMLNGYQKLYLTNSRVAFNCAYDDDGGALFINGIYDKVYLDHSHLDYNLARDNGGAIAINGTNAEIIGDAAVQEPASADYPANWAMQTYTANPYANMDGDHNQFWGKTESSSSKHVSTAGKTSTLAYNIVFNSDNDGGGGGIFVDKDYATISGLNIMKNLALGFGLDASWCGRGAGVLLNMEHSAVSDCNIWKNWARSEGGGVFNDNDYNGLVDVTITGNYSDTSGWSGGGVYVLGSVNMSLGGKCIIKDNTSYDRIKDNVRLGYHNTMYARLYPSVSADSEIGLTMAGAATTVCKVPGDYDERVFLSDDGAYHVEYTNQKLELVKGDDSTTYLKKKYPNITQTTLVPDDPITKGSRTKKLSETYTSANNRSYDLYQGVAEFPSMSDSTKDVSSTFFYSDGYFDRDPKSYDAHLATASMHLALASFYSSDGGPGAALHEYAADESGKYYEVRSNNIRQFLSDIGVQEKDIYLNDSNIQQPQTNSIGVAIGSKDITFGSTTKKLVVIGVRGGNYEREWVSNMTLGETGEAKGFSEAATQVREELGKYLDAKGIDGANEDVLFWIAGFSRAGATSNLTAARIIEDFDTNGVRTFAYTFEAPQGGMEYVHPNTARYYCIHNIVNDTDLVPQVGPSVMGFHRYGVDHYVPGDATAKANPTSKTSTYKEQSGAGASVTKTFVTFRDNASYSVGSSKYEAQKAKMQEQLKSLAGYDMFFNDYFHAATISYLGNTLFASNGWQLIDEDSGWQSHIPESKLNAAAFNEYFLEDLLTKTFDYITDSNGKAVEGLYRTCYSCGTADSMSFEQAAGQAAGVVFSLTSDQMAQFSEMAGTLMNRIDVTGLYLHFLEPIKVVSHDTAMEMEYDGVRYYSMSENALQEAMTYVDMLWNAMDKPSEEALAKDPELKSAYLKNKSLGYLYLQDILTDEQYDQLKEAFPTLGVSLLTYARADYRYTGNDMVGTLIHNIGHILSNHYPEIDLAWLRSYDSYYNGQESLITAMDGSALVKAVAAPEAVIAKDDKDEAIETGDRVEVSILNPKVELQVPGDVNQGAGIFYRFADDTASDAAPGVASDTAVHPYCGPIVLDPARENYTLQAYAIHDGIRSETSTIHVTMNSDNVFTAVHPTAMGTEATQQFALDGAADQRYYVEAPAMEERAFGEWEVTPIAAGEQQPVLFRSRSAVSTAYAAEDGEAGAVQPDGLAGFDVHARSNVFTVNKQGSYTAEAVYFDKSNGVTLVLDPVETGEMLPSWATITSVTRATDGAVVEKDVRVPVMWSAAGSGSFIATAFLPVDEENELYYIGQKKGAGFATYNRDMTAQMTGNPVGADVQMQAQGSASAVVNADGSAEVSQTFALSGYSVPAGVHTLTVQAWDLNTGALTPFAGGAESRSYLVAGGAAVLLPVPAVVSEHAVGVRSVDGLSGAELVDGDVVFTMPSGDAGMVLDYRPIVNRVTLVVDHALKAGEEMPRLVGAVASIENDWVVTDGMGIEWEPCDTVAGYRTEYTMHVTLDKASMKGAMITNGSDCWADAHYGKSVELAALFDLADDVVYVVEDEQGVEVPVSSVLNVTFGEGGGEGFGDSDNEGGGFGEAAVSLDISFAKTDVAPVVAVYNPADVSVPNGSSVEEIMAALPASVMIALADGSTDRVPAKWESGSASYSAYGYAAHVKGTAESKVYDLGDLKAVEATVMVGPKPRTNIPTVTLLVNGKPTKTGTHGEDVIVDEDTDASVKLCVEAPDGVTVMYRLAGATEYELYSEPIEVGWDTGAVVGADASTGVGDSEDAAANEKDVEIACFAKKASYRDSSLRVATYHLVKQHVHKLTEVRGQAAQESAPGWKAYYSCECGKCFEDAAGEMEITNLDAWKAEGGAGYLAPLGADNPSEEPGGESQDEGHGGNGVDAAGSMAQTGDTGMFAVQMLLAVVAFAAAAAAACVASRRMQQGLPGMRGRAGGGAAGAGGAGGAGRAGRADIARKR